MTKLDPEKHMSRFGISHDKVVLWYDVVDCHLFNAPSLLDGFEHSHFSSNSIALFQDDFVLAYDIIAIMLESLNDTDTSYNLDNFEKHMKILATLEDYAPICRRILEQRETASNDNRKHAFSPEFV